MKERIPENPSGLVENLLFIRHDLFSHCPLEVQRTIRYMWKAEECERSGDTEGYIKYNEKANESLRLIPHPVISNDEE